MGRHWRRVPALKQGQLHDLLIHKFLARIFHRIPGDRQIRIELGIPRA